MENNLNYKGIDNYTNQLSQKVVEDVFASKDAVTGKEILSITPIKQINLFIIKNLFTEWQREASTIKSPYFDYGNEKVKMALKELMNELSQNIKVKQKHLEPLLQDAIKETILLIFSPYDFYTHQIADDKQLSLAHLKSISKYIKINEKIFKSLIQKLEEEGKHTVDHPTLIKSLNEVFENTDASPEDVDQYLQQFSAIQDLDESTIYGKQEGTQVKEEPEQEVEKPQATEDESKKPIYEKFNSPMKVLNDELSESKKPSLADKHQHQKITSIEKHLSINQRFMFVRVLFNGDEEDFKKTIAHLESLEDRSNAINYINSTYPDWDYESEEVEEFIEIVEKRLA